MRFAIEICFKNRFFFHGNHLSSVTWVSDVSGVAWQHLQYEPYGGGWVDERTDEAHSQGFSSRYRFAGKERDAESGLDYFGARYYWSGGGLWLSVDPLADERPHISPYAYVQANPMIRVDREGLLDWEPVIGTDGKVYYRAEPGDNIITFMNQYDVNLYEAYEIFRGSYLNPVAKDLEGQLISGESVRNVTGSEVLRLVWDSPMATTQRKVYHIGFMLLYGKMKRENPIYINKYIKEPEYGDITVKTGNFWTGDEGKGHYIPLIGGGTLPVDFVDVYLMRRIDRAVYYYQRIKRGDDAYTYEWNLLNDFGQTNNPKIFIVILKSN